MRQKTNNAVTEKFHETGMTAKFFCVVLVGVTVLYVWETHTHTHVQTQWVVKDTVDQHTYLQLYLVLTLLQWTHTHTQTHTHILWNTFLPIDTQSVTNLLTVCEWLCRPVHVSVGVCMWCCVFVVAVTSVWLVIVRQFLCEDQYCIVYTGQISIKGGWLISKLYIYRNWLVFLLIFNYERSLYSVI